MFELKELSSTCDIVYGLSPKGIQNPDGTNYIYGTGGIVGKTNLSAFDSDSVVVPRKGSLSNPIFAEAGFWAIDTTFVAIPKAGFDAKWLYYYLDNYGLDSLNEATGVPSISRDRLSKVKIAVCSLEKQKRIAEILSAVDEQIEIETNLAEKHEKTKSSMVSKLVFNNELDGTNNKKGVFADLVDLVKDKYTPSLSDHDTRCVNLEDIPEARGKVTSWSNASANQSTKTKFLAKDILFGKLRPYLRKYAKPNFDGVCTSEILAFRAKEGVHPEYVYQIVGSSEFVNYSSSFSYGTKMPRTEWGVISKLSLMIPQLHRQLEIAAILGAIDEKIEVHKATVEKLNKVKTSLMDDLLTGKTRLPC